VEGRETRILLVKNPAGANEVLRTLALEPGSHDLGGVLNDKTADGHDVSWIWDADFELLAGRVRVATCAGTRAPELALRLKYAGIEPERIRVTEDLPNALARATADHPRPGTGASSGGGANLSDAMDHHGDPDVPATTDTGDGAPLYVLPTYTAMLALRELLVQRGEASSSWQ
jgi:hypothetical protein